MNSYLTDQQQMILDYITREIDYTGHAPTRLQIANEFEIEALKQVSNDLKILEQKGWITCQPLQNNSISLVNNVQNYQLSIWGNVEEGRVAFNKAV